MTREIKFRAWDGTERMMHLFQFYQIEKNQIPYTADDGKDYMFHLNRQPVMQYTGLKDKNGVEIYEGDIVAVTVCPHDVPKTYAITNNCEVKWRKAGFILFSGSVDINKTEFFVTIDWENELEVIGNIYQHGDLLK